MTERAEAFQTGQKRGLELVGHLAVREMPEEERPRERLSRLGPEALRDAELIAVLFRTGTRECNAVALAERLVGAFGGLRALAQATQEELKQIPGIGSVKAIELKAALELGKRLASHTDQRRSRIHSAEDVARLLMPRFKDYDVEHLVVLLLNKKNEIMRIHNVSQGGLDSTVASPREVLRPALRDGAAAVIVCHNHPSGDPAPSRDDIALTKRLAEAAELLGLQLLDHIILGDGRHVSLAERGLF